ncbi:MAG: hypothetical protein ACM3XZ_04205 [Betaproteobacteria bacterium]
MKTASEGDEAFEGIKPSPGNITNVDTPGYKRAEVRFDDVLKAAQEKSTKLWSS